MKNPKKHAKKSSDESMLFGSVTVGTKGQFVVPVGARKKFGIKPGDRLLVFGNSENKVLAVIKADEITQMVGDLTEIAK